MVIRLTEPPPILWVLLVLARLYWLPDEAPTLAEAVRKIASDCVIDWWAGPVAEFFRAAAVEI